MGNNNQASTSTQDSNTTGAATQCTDDQIAAELKLLYNCNAEDGVFRKHKFQKLWQHQTFGALIFEKLFREDYNDMFEKLDIEYFVEQCQTLLSMPTSSQQVQFYCSVFSSPENNMSKDNVDLLLRTCYELSWEYLNFSAPGLSENGLSSPASVVKGLFGSDNEMSTDGVYHWLLSSCPRMFESVHQLSCQTLRGKRKTHTQAGDTPEILQLQEQNECVLDAWSLWLLAITLPRSYLPTSATSEDLHNPLGDVLSDTGWNLLYSSNTQGLSPNRFNHHVFAYKGPTLTIFCFDEHVFCGAFDEEWRESGNKWGAGDCVLYSLKPQFRKIQSGSGMVYFNIQDRSIPKGLKIGKDARTTMLEVDADFSKVKHFGIEYPLQVVEVWGCGGRAVLEEQAKQKKWELKDAEKHKQRKLKLDDWKNNPDREILNMGGVTTEHAQR